MCSNKFKAIIIGGGPVGLTAAHAFHRAGIDFLLLERRPEMVVDAGSNLVLLPEGLRTMTQLGLADALNDISTPLSRIERLDHDGNDLGELTIFDQMKKILGWYPRVISRQGLTATLYNMLPVDAQEKILPAKKLTGLASTVDGVVVTCADYSSYAGSIVVGADGAYSATRSLMHSLLDQKDPVCAAPSPFVTTYRCLWVRFPTPPGLPLGTTCETHGYGLATQLFTGEDSGVIAVYERLEKPSSERISHTLEDQEALVDRWAKLPLTLNGSLTLQDVYTSRIGAGLVSLEEGVVRQWNVDGRVILVGDAAHKFTPSTGAGCNNGMLDVASLASELEKVLRSARVAKGEADAVPDRDQIESAFKAYGERRRKAIEAECQRSSDRTAMATWQTEHHRHLDKLSNDPALQEKLAKRAAYALEDAPRLDFLE